MNDILLHSISGKRIFWKVHLLKIVCWSWCSSQHLSFLIPITRSNWMHSDCFNYNCLSLIPFLWYQDMLQHRLCIKLLCHGKEEVGLPPGIFWKLGGTRETLPTHTSIKRESKNNWHFDVPQQHWKIQKSFIGYHQ